MRVQMPNDPTQKGHFEPIHDAHAIEHVVFVLQIDPPLDDARFVEVRKNAEQFMGDLPGRVDMQALMRLAIGIPGVAVPAASPSPFGTAFNRSRPDGTVENELRIDRNSITFRTLLYTRWDAVWKQARKYFDVLVPKYVLQSRITGMSLNYVDKFIWIGDPSECKPTQLLRTGSKYLAPHVFELSDFWHSHTGAFLRSDQQTKRLLNINVDYLEENLPENNRRVVAITTILTDMMNQPNYSALEVTPDTATEVLSTHMQELHAFGKMTFANIINDEMSKRVALID